MPVFTIKQSDKLVIGLPKEMLQSFNLQEGEQITLDVPHGPRRASQEAIDAFMSLVGIFKDDPAFDEAMKEVDALWADWDRQLNDYVSTLDS